MSKIGKIVLSLLVSGACLGGGYMMVNAVLQSDKPRSKQIDDKSSSREQVVEPKTMAYGSKLTQESRERVTNEMQAVLADYARADNKALAKFNVIGARAAGYYVSQTSNGTIVTDRSMVELKDGMNVSPITSGVFIVYNSTTGRKGLSTYEDGPTARMYHDFPTEPLTAYLLGPDAILYEVKVQLGGPNGVSLWSPTLDGKLTKDMAKQVAVFKPTENMTLQNKYQDILKEVVDN